MRNEIPFGFSFFFFFWCASLHLFYVPVFVIFQFHFSFLFVSIPELSQAILLSSRCIVSKHITVIYTIFMLFLWEKFVVGVGVSRVSAIWFIYANIKRKTICYFCVVAAVCSWPFGKYVVRGSTYKFWSYCCSSCHLIWIL